MHILLAVGDATPWWRDTLGLLSIPVLVFLNGFFVAAEFALVAVRKTRVEEMISQGVNKALAVQEAISNLDRSIAATQLGITLASLGLGWLGEAALEHIIGPVFVNLGLPLSKVASHSVAAALAFFLITFMHVVFGELIPKTLALSTPDKVSLWVAAPLMVFTKLSRPLIILMNGTGYWILRLFGHKGPYSEGTIHSVEELALIIEDTEEAGVLDSEQADLVQNVFLMSKKNVADCLIPKKEMMALELNTPNEVILEAVRKGAHTRMPVYEGESDNIVGIVNTKTLFHLYTHLGKIVLRDAIYPPIFLKPEESLANALRLFKRSRKPMALVRDDEDKIHGLITLEDVLEEIIGDIEDEHDRPALKVVRWRRREFMPPAKKK